MNPHLSFRGQCEAAFRFYEQCFGGRCVTMLKYGDSPMAKEVPPEWGTKIAHATLIADDFVLMGGDVLPEKYEQPKGFALILGMNDPVEAERVYNALAENGTVQMPLQKTFWALRFGTVVDQFGIPWAINCEEAPK